MVCPCCDACAPPKINVCVYGRRRLWYYNTQVGGSEGFIAPPNFCGPPPTEDRPAVVEIPSRRLKISGYGISRLFSIPFISTWNGPMELIACVCLPQSGIYTIDIVDSFEDTTGGGYPRTQILSNGSEVRGGTLDWCYVDFG